MSPVPVIATERSLSQPETLILIGAVVLVLLFRKARWAWRDRRARQLAAAVAWQRTQAAIRENNKTLDRIHDLVREDSLARRVDAAFYDWQRHEERQ